MWKNVKRGLGLVVGIELGVAAVKAVKIMSLAAFGIWLANNETEMEELKKEKPHLYEKLKKYKVEKDEESVEKETEEES